MTQEDQNGISYKIIKRWIGEDGKEKVELEFNGPEEFMNEFAKKCELQGINPGDVMKWLMRAYIDEKKTGLRIRD